MTAKKTSAKPAVEGGPGQTATTKHDPKPVFGERLAEIRRSRDYVQKQTRHGMKDIGGKQYSAVMFDELVEDVRHLFLEHGLSWHTHAADVECSEMQEFSGTFIIISLIKYVIRFQNVEGPMNEAIGELWYRDVEVIATAFDVYDPQSSNPQGDKGTGKANTYAQKMALRQILNLPAGDDPDFTPLASLATREKGERTELLGRLERAIKLLKRDPDVEIPKLIRETNEEFQRAIGDPLDMDTAILRGWVMRAEGKVEELSNDNDGGSK